MKAQLWSRHEQTHHMSSGEAFWRKNSSKVRCELGVPRESSPWTSLRDVRLLGVTLCDRQLDLADVAWESRCKEGHGRNCHAQLRAGFWVDLSQSVVRRPWASVLRGFRGRGHCYSYEADRCLDGLDVLKVHGWPKHLLAGTSAGDLLNLGADTTSVPLSTLLMALLWSSPWGEWNTGRP